MASVSILIGSVYAVVSPLLLPVLVVYFLLGYAVYINQVYYLTFAYQLAVVYSILFKSLILIFQIEDVYETVYETCGLYWPYIHHYIYFGFILMQITMIGLFGLKSKPGPAIATIPLVFGTILFNEYCKMRFLPTFLRNSVQVHKSLAFLLKVSCSS